MTTQIVPPVPGAIIRRKVLKRLALRQSDLARAMGVSKVRINHIVNGRAPITPEMALRLAKVTSTDPAYWLNLQSALDLFRARKRLGDSLDELMVLHPDEEQPIDADRY